MKKNPLIETFGKEKRWVNYKLQTRKGQTTKVPYSVSGKLASSIDEKTWSTYDEAKANHENVGIIFTPSQNLLGIDLDKCLEGRTIKHKNGEMIMALLAEANTYTEISPSKTGLHLFFKLSKGMSLTANRHENFEVYTSGRYFTVTEMPFGKVQDVRTITPEEALELLSLIGYPWNKTEPVISTHDSGNISSSSLALDDSSVIEKMFKSKNGLKIKALCDTQNGNSEDDLSLCSHLAFWTGKNAPQMERLWLSSPLGQRKKTQSRKDYRTRTIQTAIASCKEIYETPFMAIQKENPELDLLYFTNKEKDKVFIQNTENICRILRSHEDFANRFHYDVFTNVIEILSLNPRTQVKKWRALEDNDAVNIQTNIQIAFSCFSKVGKDMVYDAMIKVAKENTIDSAIDYITSLKWDGVARLDTWLCNTYGVPDDIYHKAVASNWIKGLVKRIVDPGCKFDYVLVLEGEQGTRKSTSLATLGGNWHVETAMSTETKDFFMQFCGKAIIEFSEGETLSRTEVKRMKAIITMQSDKYRPPYERTSQEFPRRCVFSMTTNQSEYLKDETGNRRWLPITVQLPEADVNWLQENRNQIFAEAYVRLQNGETVYEFPKEETLAAQQARRIHEPNADLITHWYVNKVSEEKQKEGITTHEVYRDALNGGFAQRAMNRFEEMSIADILKNTLGLIKKREMYDGVRSTRWFQPEIQSPLNLEIDLSKAKKDIDPLDNDWPVPTKKII